VRQQEIVRGEKDVHLKGGFFYVEKMVRDWIGILFFLHPFSGRSQRGVRRRQKI
jgi:hypothetical protein